MRMILAVMVVAGALTGAQGQTARGRSYLGFDRNEYPGDEALVRLRMTFAYAGYWLNEPPGASQNSWKGKRQLLNEHGFGFLVLFNGKTYQQLKNSPDAARQGTADAKAVLQSAHGEGFRGGTTIFLDIEEGGRLLPEQKAYVLAWIDGVNASGFVAGVYCSGIDVKESGGTTINTASDIRQSAGARKVRYWIANDQCPPSPGCSLKAPDANGSGFSGAEVWQYVQSPRRPQFTAACKQTYNVDGNCYPPGFDPSSRLHVDLNSARTQDPSHGRRR